MNVNPFRLRLRALLAVLGAAFALAACGGADGPVTTSTAAASVSTTATGSARARIQSVPTGGVSARYVKFEAISEVNGNPWASVAEFDLLDAAGSVMSRAGWSVTADSQETAGEDARASYAIDGDPHSFWHTQWQGGSPAMPHSLTIDLGAVRAIGGFRYLPRQVGVNGRIASWRFHVSSDGRTWTQVADGVFTSGADEATVLVTGSLPSSPPPVLAGASARYVRLEALSEINGNPWASLAEFNLLDAGGAVVPRNGWTASADSQELVGETAPASYAIDGDAGSIWHTQWQGGSPAMPHALTIDLGVLRTLGGFKVLPRQSGVNGRIAGWRFLASADNATWTLVAQGSFDPGAAEKTVTFAASQPAADQPPTLAAVADRAGTVGVSTSLALAASDPDGDSLVYAASGLPAGLAIDASSGLIAGTPTAPGRSVVGVSVGDGRGGTASRSFAWSIAAAAIPPAAGTVRYVRFEALSEVNGNPWTSVAEFNLLDAAGVALSRSGWTASADSQETVGEDAPANHAIDGDPGSIWHTQWLGNSAPPPHSLTVDLGAPRKVGGFRYLPRQSGVNGRIASWRFWVGSDGSQWTLAAEGSFPSGDAEQTVLFGATQPAPTPSPSPSPSAARAARIAAFASGPLVAGPAWRAGEAVTVDSVRRLASGQHLLYTTGGTTGGAEPVLGGNVLDGRPIPDGGAIAYVNGRVLTASQPGAPVVSAYKDAAAAGLVETRFALGDFQAPRIATVQGCRSISIGTSFLGHYCYANGTASGSGNATAFAAGTYGAGLSAANTYHANSWEEEFVVTDRAFGLVFANSASPINVEIDGVQVQAAPASSSGVEGWTLVFDYQGVTKRRTVRVVSAVGSVAPTLRGVALAADGRVEAGTSSNDQLLVLGDSINATVTPTSEAGAQILSYWLQRDLGFGAAINMAVGGSGYVQANPNTFSLPTLLANAANRTLIAGYAPNITHVFIGAGFNDRRLPPTTVRAAALSTWRTLRALLPNARISISDGWSGSLGPDGDALALAVALSSAFAEWGDGNARLIHSIGSSTAAAYVSGTGNAGTAIQTGNSSVYTSTDAVHPSPAGARYLARRLADDISAAWGGAY